MTITHYFTKKALEAYRNGNTDTARALWDAAKSTLLNK